MVAYIESLSPQQMLKDNLYTLWHTFLDPSIN